jgi:hypothetical protein
MLSIHLRLGLPSGLFPSGFPTSNLYTFLFSPIRAHLILLDFIILIQTAKLPFLNTQLSTNIVIMSNVIIILGNDVTIQQKRVNT